MSEQTDTLASVAIELGKLLEPLRTELVAPRTKGFFAEMGIPLTDAQATALAGPLTTIVDDTEALLTLIPEIITAADDEEWGTVVQKAILATVKICEVVVALDDLATAAQGLAVPDAGVLAKRIFDTLIAHYLDAVRGLNDILEFIGLLDRQDFNVDSTDPANPFYTVHTYDFGAIGEWLSDPAGKATSLYGWGPGFDGQLLFPRLERLIGMSGMPAFYDETASSRRLNLIFVDMVPITSGAPGVVIRLCSKFGSGTVSLPLGPDATLELQAAADMPLGTELAIRTDGSVSFTPPSVTSFDGEFGAKLIVRRDPPEPFVIFGQAEGSRLEFGDFILSVLTKLQMSGGMADGELDVKGELNDGKVVINGGEGDGFISRILSGTDIEADFSVFMGVSTERGFYFGGSSALEVRLPVHIEIGPISIDALTLGAGFRDGEIPLSLGADIGAELGPISAVVQNMGVATTLSFPPGNTGNLGAAQLDISFKPPNGVGLRVEAGPITGGGFLSLDYEKGEYIGALELSFRGVFSLKAVGIINTKMPDGSKGFALLILVTAEFTPIQLGFGFTLIGVGGLLGLNRSLDSEALRVGVRTGSVNSVLFPPDVIGNIVQIVSDLNSFFPIVEAHFVVAPMGKLGWGAIITLELGVILDIPVPQLTIIGVLRAILPDESAPILRLQVNFAGGIDFDRGLIWFDASLFDSNLLVFTLSGDMALRIGWGDQKLFILSVGGFHPAFKEVPQDLTGMKRLGIALLSGDNPRLVAEAYFAITSNTVQSGARVELYAGACGFNIYGFLGYDLLIQFKPFHFIASIYAGLALRAGSSVIAGIDVFCELSGPTPWNARGHAKFKILFFSIKIRFDVTWGQDPVTLPEDTVDVLDLVEEAVQDGRNWTTALPVNAQQTVTLRETDLPEDVLLLHPFGVLSVSQKVVPFGLKIEKFGNRAPAGDTKFTIAWGGSDSENEREEFAIANFLKLSDDEKLSRKSFESIWSGLRFATGDASETGATVDRDVTYEMSYLRRKTFELVGVLKFPEKLFNIMSCGGSVTKNKLSVSARKAGGNGPTAVGVTEGGYQVVTVEDLSPAFDGARTATQAEAYALFNEIIRENPSMAGRIQVMADHELYMEGAA